MSMSNISEKRRRFEQLLEQADIREDIQLDFLADSYLERVIVNRENSHWTFVVVANHLLPAPIYNFFRERIRSAFSHIVVIELVFQYDSQLVSDEKLVETYWENGLLWIQSQVAAVNGWLTYAKFSVTDGTITLSLLDKIGKEMARKKCLDLWLKRYYNDFFSREFAVEFDICDSFETVYETFAQQIIDEEKIAATAMMNFHDKDDSSLQVVTSEKKLVIGLDIKELPLSIQDIHEEANKVVIQGMVFGLEVKELKTGTMLYQFYVTDFSDSLMVKAFVKGKEDLKSYRLIADSKWFILRGRVEYDRFGDPPELMMIPQDMNEIAAPPQRSDSAAVKRVELHLHTAMSTMDGITPIDEYIKTAALWGHKAIAITDHGGVQAFPDANKAAKKHGLKVLYGVEANIVNDSIPMVYGAINQELADAEFIIFDIETTGLSISANKIIEIAAVRMCKGEVKGQFTSFVNPHESIPFNITQLTHIHDEMVADAPDIAEILPRFMEFIGDATIVAHNARFDMGFLQANCRSQGIPECVNPVLDTLELARFLFPSFKNHRLNTLADKFKVKLDGHHRAIADVAALGEILLHLIKVAGEQQITNLNQLNDYAGMDLRNARPFHCCIYAKNLVGKKNLFKLISLSHTEYYHKVATIPRSKLIQLREGLLIASGCEKGEFFETVLNKSMDEAEQAAHFYDVLEIQPIGLYMHLVEKGLVGHRDQLEATIKRICTIGDKLNKPVVATGNVHYLHPNQKLNRDITIFGITGFSPLKDMNKPDVHLRTTEEMLAEFQFLGEAKAQEVVVSNTVAFAEMFDEIDLFPHQGGPRNNGLFSPLIEGSDEEIRQKCYEAAKKMYDDPLPDLVAARLEKELKPIIQYGFSANYLISERLVRKSNENGYLVGSRGSVGSSFVATMLGISEVNPLPPHYICAGCQYSLFFTDGSIPNGFDLPLKQCPQCGETLRGDGQDIPFETFLGFKGDKVPDIDLNFSGEYQAQAHNYTKEIFGEKNVFRAGTIGTIADKTAFGYVKKYAEDKGMNWRTAEVNRLANGCTGVKRSSGQHPGGIVIIPDYIDVEDITPIQYPADDQTSEWKTTHFDYHSFEENLLKLDILGHDDPTMMRMLQDLTGVDPTTIPMNDSKVMRIFNSTESIGVKPEQIRSTVATYGIPEMGTKFVRQMLTETNPTTFADLIQISGLSHGTGVWIGNAQGLIQNGTCDIKTVIGCRDDIMLYLIYKCGMEAALAFKITESVRRGRGLTEEWKSEMKKHQVPNWYISSCERIEYMFPKAHAAAYVISAVRTAYFKVYYPIEYYAAYFSVRAEEFDIGLFCQGYDAIYKRLNEIESKGFQATSKEKSMISILEIGLEMTARKLIFKPVDIYKSAADRFKIDGNSLISPFSSVPGIGGNAAKYIAAAKENYGDFLSVEDFQQKTKVSKTVIELLNSLGCFHDMPESNQLSFF